MAGMQQQQGQQQSLAYLTAVDLAAALENRSGTFIAIVGDQPVQVKTRPGHSIVQLIAVPKSPTAWTIFEVSPEFTRSQEESQYSPQLERSAR